MMEIDAKKITLRKVGSGITETFEVWTDQPVDDVTLNEKVLAIRKHAIEHAKNESKQLEVCRLLVEQCDRLLEALEAGDLEAVGWLAFELGELHERLVIKWGWEDHALRGEKVVVAAAKGSDARSANNRQRDKEMAEEFERRSERSKKSSTALKEEIGRARGLKRNASINAVDRGLLMLKISSG